MNVGCPISIDPASRDRYDTDKKPIFTLRRGLRARGSVAGGILLRTLSHFLPKLSKTPPGGDKLLDNRYKLTIADFHPDLSFR